MNIIWQMCITGLEKTVSFQISPESQHFLTELLIIKWTNQMMDRMISVFCKDQHSTRYECVMEKNLALRFFLDVLAWLGHQQGEHIQHKAETT